MTLPADFNDLDVLGGALALARAGFFVLPLRGSTAGDDAMAWKAPLKGLSWTDESTRDTKKIVAWFAGTSGLGVGIDCGKSGLVVLDEDRAGVLDPAMLTPTLTSMTGKGRHYIYRQPGGRTIGGSTGKLPKAFGDVRGHGGLIVAPPSPHASGVRYRFVDPGTAVAELPAAIADLLHDRDLAEDAATDEDVERFFTEHVDASRRGLLTAVVRSAKENVAQGASRHATFVAAACWAMREARAGFYPARQAADRLGRVFVQLLAKEAEQRKRKPEAEWRKILRWAVAQAGTADVDEVRRKVEARVPSRSLAELWEAVDSYLEDVDRLPILVVLAAAATTALDGDPLWLLLVGAPSGGKTEAVRLVERIANDSIDELTSPAALLSWSKGKNPTRTGLLSRITTDRALVTIRDLSSLLAASDRGARDEVYGKLRTVFDGYCHREVGQHPPLIWRGRLTIVAAVTPAIDHYASHAQALGDRWLYLRLAGGDAEASLARALRVLDADADAVDKARNRAQQVAETLVEAARRRVVDVQLSPAEQRALADAALVVSRARANVPRNGYGRREVEGVAVVEEPPRIARHLGQLVRGLVSLGLEPDDALAAGIRAAIESVPITRSRVLDALVDGEPLTVAELARRTGLHRHVARMQVEELAVVGVAAIHGEDDDDDDAARRTSRPWRIAGDEAPIIQRVFLAYRDAMARKVGTKHTSPHTGGDGPMHGPYSSCHRTAPAPDHLP